MAKEKSLEKAVEDFKVYAQGVKRLRELEKELNSLNTKKFKRQERALRKKLKNVALIPIIEHDLRKLKLQISGVDTEYQKTRLDKKQSRKISILERKSGHLDHIPKLQSRVSYIRHLIDSREEDIEKEISKVRGTKVRKQLTKQEVKDIKGMPSLRGKINYLRALLKEDIERLEKVESMTEKIPFLQRRLTEDSKRLKKIGARTEKIPLVQARISYLRRLLDSREEDLEKEISKVRGKKVRKQLTKQEVKELRAIPHLRGKTDYIETLLRKDIERLEKIETKMEKIPFMQGKIKTLFGMLGNKSEQIAREEGDIEKLKHRFGYLKHELEEKSDELEQKLIRRTKSSEKKKVLEEIYRLREKIDNTKLELNERLNEGISESRWDMEKEKQDLRQEISELAAESKGLIEQEAQEINEQLLEELSRITKKSKNIKKELHSEFLDRLLQVRTEFDERLEDLEKNSEKQKNLKQAEEAKEKGISEDIEEKTEFEQIPQPFVPPKKFSKIKISKIKFEKPKKIKGEELSFDNLSDNYKLPMLPQSIETGFSPIATKAYLDGSFQKDLGESKEKIKEFKEEHQPEHEKHLLPQLSKKEFMKDLKQAVIEERNFLAVETKKTKEISSQKQIIKKELFLKLVDFQKAEHNLGEIDIKVRVLEKEFKEIAKEKQSEQKEIQDIIENAEKISKEFSKVNIKLLRKIKEV